MSTEWGGFKLGDKTALQLNIIMNDGPGFPILSGTRDRTSVIPGRNGLYYFGADLEPLRFAIPCAFIFANSTEQLAEHAADLRDHLIDSTTKQPKKLTLIFENDKDTEHEVYYSGILDLTRTIFDGQFTLPLMAPDPFDPAPLVIPEPVEPVKIDPDTKPQEQVGVAYAVTNIFWQDFS